MAAVDTVFEQLGSMTVLELVELKKKIEDEWGITAAAPMAFAAPDSPLRAPCGTTGTPNRLAVAIAAWPIVRPVPDHRKESASAFSKLSSMLSRLRCARWSPLGNTVSGSALPVIGSILSPNS